MIPYSIRSLQGLIAEKQQKIRDYELQIGIIKHHLNDEAHMLLVDIPDVYTNFYTLCVNSANPVGYCVYPNELSDQDCVFCHMAHLAD